MELDQNTEQSSFYKVNLNETGGNSAIVVLGKYHIPSTFSDCLTVKQEEPEADNSSELLPQEVLIIKTEGATNKKCEATSSYVPIETEATDNYYAVIDENTKQELVHEELIIKNEDEKAEETCVDDNFNRSKVKRFKCLLCDYGCYWKYNLERHLRAHTGDRPFKCNICDYTCEHKAHLNTHLITHTDKKPFNCNICDYSCRQRNSLKLHLIAHTGDKPFKCDHCDYSTVYKYAMQVHLRTHAGVKPFKCNICDYSCGQNSNLKNHLLTHTGEKPFKCNVCNNTFSRKNTLKRHMKTHRPSIK